MCEAVHLPLVITLVVIAQFSKKTHVVLQLEYSIIITTTDLSAVK
jgi:hypothetical protein